MAEVDREAEEVDRRVAEDDSGGGKGNGRQ